MRFVSRASAWVVCSSLLSLRCAHAVAVIADASLLPGMYSTTTYVILPAQWHVPFEHPAYQPINLHYRQHSRSQSEGGPDPVPLPKRLVPIGYPASPGATVYLMSNSGATKAIVQSVAVWEDMTGGGFYLTPRVDGVPPDRMPELIVAPRRGRVIVPSILNSEPASAEQGRKVLAAHFGMLDTGYRLAPSGSRSALGGRLIVASFVRDGNGAPDSFWTIWLDGRIVKTHSGLVCWLGPLISMDSDAYLGYTCGYPESDIIGDWAILPLGNIAEPVRH